VFEVSSAETSGVKVQILGYGVYFGLEGRGPEVRAICRDLGFFSRFLLDIKY
jgi:hypothetical protein